MHSISTGTPLGSCLAAIQERAGLWVKNFSYCAFISAKFDMSSRKTCNQPVISYFTSTVSVNRRMKFGLTLTRIILLTDDPAASRMALMLSQQAWVLVAMSPSTRLPFLSAGIWPERKIWPFALTA